ncbi:MAG: MlaD family protein [Longimicrobiales bacterium]
MAAFERQRRDMLLGGLIILGMTVFGIGLFFMDAFVAALQDQDEIVAVLPEAPKLAAGAEVWIGGKHVGEVISVGFMPFRGDSLAHIAATLRFPHKLRDEVRKDSHIRVTSARIIGAPVIDISVGTAAFPVIGPNDTLFLAELVTIPRLHEKLTLIGAAFDSARTEIAALGGAGRARLKSLAPVMQNMSVAQAQVADIMGALQNGAAADFMADPGFRNDLTSLQRSARELGPAFSRATANLTGAQRAAAPSLKHMQGNAERLSAAIGKLLEMVNTENGTLHRMSADSALLKSLQGVKAQLDSLIIEAKKNPLKFVL